MNKKSKQTINNDLIGDNEMMSTFNHVVDYIMAKRVGLNGKVEYLVKWEGWHPRTATWEPLSNFASPQIVKVFEDGIRQQMGQKEAPIGVSLIQTSSDFIKNTSKTKASSKRKSKWLEPMATKYFEKFRKSSKKFKNKSGSNQLSPRKLFDISITNIQRIESVIQRYEPLVGASRRKSRMSCPSSPVKHKLSPKPLLSERSKRYRKRDLKINIPKNTSLEENKNPLNGSLNSEVLLNLKSIKKSITNRRQMKVNNDSNKMAKRLCLQMDDNNESHSNSSDALEDSPSKVFINKVKERLSAVPHNYQKFLNEILEFQSINLEFNEVLNRNQELINGFFDILFINRENLLIKNDSTPVYPHKKEEDIDKHISKWLEKVNKSLETDQKKRFWNFFDNKSKSDILKASPDYLLLRINNELLSNHSDLCEEFQKFMPTLCAKLYNLYSNI